MRIRAIPGSLLLILPVVTCFAAAQYAVADDVDVIHGNVSAIPERYKPNEFGVMVINGSLDEPARPTADAVEIVPPVLGRNADPYTTWRENARPMPPASPIVIQQRFLPGEPPWQYKAPDQTYKPTRYKSYRPQSQTYVPARFRRYVRKTDWTYRPKHFGQWR